MTAESSFSLAASAEVLWPRTEAAGVADAMIEAQISITESLRQGRQGAGRDIAEGAQRR